MKADAEKQYKTYTHTSRYESFPYYYDDINNRYYYGLTSTLSPEISYALYEVKPGDSYDSIASDYYGSALYYWIICNFNDIFDALQQPEVGTILKIPALSDIKFEQR